MYDDDNDENDENDENDVSLNVSGELTPAQRELEDAMRGLSPTVPTIDRDHLLFDAGVAAARRSVTRWRWTCGIAAMVAVTFGVALVVVARGAGRDTRVVRELVYVDRVPDATSAPSQTPTPTSSPRFDLTGDTRLLLAGPRDVDYLRMRDRVLRWGVTAALPATSTLAQPSRTPDVNQLLGAPASAEDPANERRAPGRSLKQILLFGDRS